MGFAMGLWAFALFFLSDYNDWRLHRRGLAWAFPLGALLLAAGTVLSASRGEAPVSGWLRGLFSLFAAVFLALLVHTLFFALPVGDSYARPGKARPVRTTGVYALCRHPGVLWFAGAYFCLWGAFGLPLWQVAGYSLLNLGLVVFEDRRVFPSKLEGYGGYCRTTPFLIPNRRSLRAFRHSPLGGEHRAV